MKLKAKTIDEYLSFVPDDRRKVLQKLRVTIRSIVPAAEECISYGIPAFRYRGNVIAGFCARRNGCTYFPFSGSTLARLAGDLTEYGGTKSALHFGCENPLPRTIVRKLLKKRIAELK